MLFGFLQQAAAAVEDQGTVEEQHILVFKVYIISNQIRGDITGVDQGHSFVVLHQQGHHGASVGIPEDDQFPVSPCIGIFDHQNILGAGEEHIVKILALGILHIDLAFLAADGIANRTATQYIAFQHGDGLRLDRQGGLAVIDAVEGAVDHGFGKILCLRGGHTHSRADDRRGFRQFFLPPVGIGAVVIFLIQSASDIVRKLNALGGKHGIGICDIVENRVVGMKSRGVYETPGGTILMEAHMQLEELILDRATMNMKKVISAKLADVVYEGTWFTPLREALQAFVETTQKYVTGEVKFVLYKGNIIKAGTTSDYSLYNASLASFETGDLYDHKDAEGFITLFGLPLKVRAMKMQEVEENNK